MLPVLIAAAVVWTGCESDRLDERADAPNGEKRPAEGRIEGVITLEASDDHFGVAVTLFGGDVSVTRAKDGSSIVEDFADLHVHTASNGSFAIEDVAVRPAGYGLRVEKEGFEAVETRIDVFEDRTSRVQLELRRLIPEPPPLPNP